MTKGFQVLYLIFIVVCALGIAILGLEVFTTNTKDDTTNLPPNNKESSTPPLENTNNIDTLIVLGDSISAAGYVSKPYKEVLVERLQEDQQKTIKIIDLAKGGARLEHISERQIPQIVERDLGNTIVVMTIGGNNVKQYKEGDFYISELERLVLDQGNRFDHDLKTAFFNLKELDAKNVDIYLTNIYDPGDGLPWPIEGNECWNEKNGLAGPITQDALVRTNMLLKQLASLDTRFHIVDIHSEFIGHGFGTGESDFWFKDCVHPNTKGHSVIADLFYKEIVKNYNAF